MTFRRVRTLDTDTMMRMFGATMACVGAWVRPWPGEKVVGEVVAVSGEDYLCRCVNGELFRIRREPHPEMLTPDEVTYTVRRYAGEQRRRSHLEVVR